MAGRLEGHRNGRARYPCRKRSGAERTVRNAPPSAFASRSILSMMSILSMPGTDTGAGYFAKSESSIFAACTTSRMRVHCAGGQEK